MRLLGLIGLVTLAIVGILVIGSHVQLYFWRRKQMRKRDGQ